MSTRCHIAIYENDKHLYEPTAILYRHWDGYPGTEDGTEYGVLPDIMPVIRDFNEHRGSDPEYLAARILGTLLNQNPDEKYLGYGITNKFYGGTDYLYAVYPDKVQVYEDTRKGCWTKRFTLLQEVKI